MLREIRLLQSDLCMSSGELLRLAREAAQDGGLVSIEEMTAEQHLLLISELLRIQDCIPV